ncbi:MAG: tetratricopeptide repeat protein, partial [candidate division NC10 bacterium]|nr:tetratricopeptide repeat protein [candidate division NC10 bacterium]
WAQARLFFRKILLRDPNNISAFLRLGEISLQEGDYSEAIRLHLKARNLDPDNLEVLLDLERDYERAGQIDEAIRVLEAIRERFKENLDARQKLRSLYIQKEMWEKAWELQKDLLKSFRSGTEADSQRRTLLGCRYEMGNAKLKEKDFKEAAKIFREVAKLEKVFLPAYLKLGETYYLSGEKGKAGRIWERAFDITRSSVFLERLEQLYLEMEDPQRLLSFYHLRILRSPHDLVPRFYLGKLYYRLEMIDEAEEQFRLLTQKVPGFALPHYLLAQILERRRAWREALSQYKEVLSLLSLPLFQYRCSRCGTRHLGWQDRCSKCGEWNSLSEELRSLIGPPESSILHSPIRF